MSRKIAMRKLRNYLMVLGSYLAEKPSGDITTHILRQARRLADYVVFMYFGEVVEKGHPDEVFEYPKTDTLKQYLEVGH